MKKTTINISYDEEKLSALKIYLAQKETTAENELVKALDTMYTKTVPAGVREFIEMRSGVTSEPIHSRKHKTSSAVGENSKENQNG
ncbi:MAG: DUF6103 family protein, partial [Firmicutes bacterium]|nr:DUF6103 family protein [Bacillota bacterium]